MGSYIPSTKAQQEEMLAVIGLKSKDELYDMVPKHLLIDELDIPKGKSEFEVKLEMTAIARKNTVFPTIFRGAGAYRHYIPSIVNSIISRQTFLTAYTPYQAEISQGILQTIFEYQTMICELTGMDASNASVYDGATAAAEAITMCRDRKRQKALISAAANPQTIEVIKTYCRAANIECELIPDKNGVTDSEILKQMLNETTACVYIQQPNFFGVIEDCGTAGELIRAGGAKFIMGINPISAAILKTPAECGADIAVGDGQPLGMPLSYGGPYLGFMAATTEMMRKLPGRIVGETTDTAGNRVFVLTLQAREQHIRRERASSNICSNEALCAMAATVYMTATGAGGMAEAAEQSAANAHYLAAELDKLGFTRRYDNEFFHEFITESPIDIDILMNHLESNGILGGLPMGNGILWCATELNTQSETDKLIRLIREVL